MTTMHTFKTLYLSLGFTAALMSCKNDNDNTPPVVKDYHQTAETKFVQADTVKYAYRELGNAGGIPLVMISPLGGSMDDWDPAITNGLAQQYRVIIFDLQGVGSTSGKTPASIADMAKGTVSFIHALGLQKVNLFGFSMGSFISQQIALTTPSLINKIMLTGVGPKGAIGLSNLPNLLAASAGLSAEDSFLKFGFTSSAASVAAGKASWQRTLKRVENRDLPTSQESAGAEVQAVLAWAQPDANALNELKTITQPVLIAQGEADVPVPVQNAKNMAQYLPNAKLVIYPDAAHAAVFQNPDLFVPAAISFLGK